MFARGHVKEKSGGFHAIKYGLLIDGELVAISQCKRYFLTD